MHYLTYYLTHTTTLGHPQLPLLPSFTNDIIHLQTECLLHQQLSIEESGQWAQNSCCTNCRLVIMRNLIRTS